jgi:protein phosphatase
MPTTFDFALKTHPGLVRPLNEDAMGADPQSGLFILADGLGGYNAGEIASTMAVSTLLGELTDAQRVARESGDVFDPARVLRDALVVMNANIFRAALNSTAFEGMATTVVIAWILDDTLWVAHTGDSRLYRHRAGTLEQLTRDHSFSQELLDAGMVTEEEARLLPAKNLVTRALGASPDIEPEVRPYDLNPDDVLLLCSDGLTEMVTHYEIGGLIEACDRDLDDTARRLVDMANEAGGRDNTSVILIRVGEVAAPEETAETETEPQAKAEDAESAEPSAQPTVEQSAEQSPEQSAKPPAEQSKGNPPDGDAGASKPTGDQDPAPPTPTNVSLATPGPAGRID